MNGLRSNDQNPCAVLSYRTHKGGLTLNATDKAYSRLLPRSRCIHPISILVCGFALLFAVEADAQQAKQADPETLVSEARDAFREIVTESNDSELKQQAREAQAVLIIPDYLKAGLVLGASGGHGVALVRHGDKWSGPAFYSVDKPSLGLQAGYQTGKTVSFMMTKKGRDTLTVNWVKGGATLSAAAGRRGVGQGDHGLDMITYASTEGLFAGFSFDMSSIRPNDQLNEQYYGRPVTPSDILSFDQVSNSKSAELKAEIIKAAAP